jgi:hypothetical protein
MSDFAHPRGSSSSEQCVDCEGTANPRYEGAEQHRESADELNENRRPTHKFRHRNADGMRHVWLKLEAQHGWAKLDVN